MSQKISLMDKLPTLTGATKIPTGEPGPGGNYATDPDQIASFFGSGFWPLGGTADLTDNVTINGAAFAVTFNFSNFGVTSTGNITLGSTSVANATHQIIAESSGANSGFDFFTKGSSNIRFFTAPSTHWMTFTAASGSIAMGSPTMAGTTKVLQVQSSDADCELRIVAQGAGIITLESAGYVQLGRTSFGSETQQIFAAHGGPNDIDLVTRAKGVGNFIWQLGDISSQTEIARLTDIGLGVRVVTPTAVLHLAASTTARASLRVPDGTAPTSPNQGDIWSDTGALKYYDGTTTKTLAFV